MLRDHGIEPTDIGIEHELCVEVPRHTHFRPTNSILRQRNGAALVVSLAITLLYAASLCENSFVTNYGQVVSAKTALVSTSAPSDEPRMSLVKFTYKDNGRSYSAQDLVPYGDYLGIGGDNMVKLKVLPSAPFLSPVVVPPTQWHSQSVYWNLGGLIVAGCTSLMFTVLILWRVYYEFKLVAKGEVTLGMLVAKSRGHNRALAPTLTYQYAVALPMGRTLLAECAVPVTPLEYTNALLGDTITILYDDSRPENGLIYKRSLFEVADAV